MDLQCKNILPELIIFPWEDSTVLNLNNNIRKYGFPNKAMHRIKNQNGFFKL